MQLLHYDVCYSFCTLSCLHVILIASITYLLLQLQHQLEEVDTACPGSLTAKAVGTSTWTTSKTSASTYASSPSSNILRIDCCSCRALHSCHFIELRFELQQSPEISQHIQVPKTIFSKLPATLQSRVYIDCNKGPNAKLVLKCPEDRVETGDILLYWSHYTEIPVFDKALDHNDFECMLA